MQDNLQIKYITGESSTKRDTEKSRNIVFFLFLN